MSQRRRLDSVVKINSYTAFTTYLDLKLAKLSRTPTTTLKTLHFQVLDDVRDQLGIEWHDIQQVFQTSVAVHLEAAWALQNLLAKPVPELEQRFVRYEILYSLLEQIPVHDQLDALLAVDGFAGGFDPKNYVDNLKYPTSRFKIKGKFDNDAHPWRREHVSAVRELYKLATAESQANPRAAAKFVNAVLKQMLEGGEEGTKIERGVKLYMHLMGDYSKLWIKSLRGEPISPEMTRTPTQRLSAMQVATYYNLKIAKLYHEYRNLPLQTTTFETLYFEVLADVRTQVGIEWSDLRNILKTSVAVHPEAVLAFQKLLPKHSVELEQCFVRYEELYRLLKQIPNHDQLNTLLAVDGFADPKEYVGNLKYPISGRLGMFDDDAHPWRFQHVRTVRNLYTLGDVKFVHAVLKQVLRGREETISPKIERGVQLYMNEMGDYSKMWIESLRGEEKTFLPMKADTALATYLNLKMAELSREYRDLYPRTQATTLKTLHFEVLADVRDRLGIEWHDIQQVFKNSVPIHPEAAVALQNLLPKHSVELEQCFVRYEKLYSLLKQISNHHKLNALLAVDGFAGTQEETFDPKKYVDNLKYPMSRFMVKGMFDDDTHPWRREHVSTVRELYDLVEHEEDPQAAAKFVYAVLKQVLLKQGYGEEGMGDTDNVAKIKKGVKLYMSLMGDDYLKMWIKSLRDEKRGASEEER